MAKSELIALLQQRWIHSYEEDSETTIVYRPADFDFPPSRGRTGFELRTGYQLIDIAPGRGDALREQAGTWQLLDRDGARLQLRFASGEQAELQVLSAEKDRLVVRKTEGGF